MSENFQFDVFLNHSAKDKQAVPVPNAVRELAARLRRDGLSPNAKGRRLKAKAELQPSAFSLQPLLHDPLNRERRFIPLRLDDASIRELWALNPGTN